MVIKNCFLGGKLNKWKTYSYSLKTWNFAKKIKKYCENHFTTTENHSLVWLSNVVKKPIIFLEYSPWNHWQYILALIFIRRQLIYWLFWKKSNTLLTSTHNHHYTASVFLTLAERTHLFWYILAKITLFFIHD